MAQNTLGRNLTFPIYNADGTSFHNLVLHKAVVDSVVMSLGDKITGDVYYKDNALDVTMHEYIMFKRNPNDENEDAVKYVLVSPPTIVREGMVSDNSELKGMTKYSFVFYHPMYVLNNIPFSDVAVTTEQERYLSQNKEFSWIGYPDDFIAKVNKNLQQTQWTVEKSSRFPNEKDSVLSGVLSFSNNTIADALKTWYDTWEIPYVIDVVKSGEQGYSDGKRFKIVFGLPSTEIYAQGNNSTPFVFQMGKGLGLKNNSRTPRNNKIITRISGYGSESNIPYGYPQIIWTGNQEWGYTINNASGMQTITVGGKTIQAMSYPIYDGIVGGQKVRLIKHPFTRTHLMPTVYSETVNKKVNPLNPNYNPNGEILDYYDAVATQEYPYVNEIDPSAPSYEIHQFEDIKPEMNVVGEDVEIVDAVPLNADLTPADAWDDTLDDEGKYVQSFFRLDLPILPFDIYACASITEEMSINMRSGACMGCTFNVQVDWEDYKRNFYKDDGTFDPVIHTTSGDGHVRNGERYPDSSQTAISLIVQKDNETFGTIMPNVYQKPYQGDKFVVLGISLPVEYITNAEETLDAEMKSYMLENNVHYYDYPLKFDEYFLATHTAILSQIKPNAIVHFAFGDIAQPLELYVKQLTIKYEQGVLPQYDITLTDNIEVVLNQIGQVADDVERLSSVISMMREGYSRNVWTELAKKLSKVSNDTATGAFVFEKLLTLLGGIKGDESWQIDAAGNARLLSLLIGQMYGIDGEGVGRLRELLTDSVKGSSYTGEDLLTDKGFRLWTDDKGNGRITVDYLNVRKKFTAMLLEIMKTQYSGGNIVMGCAGSVLSKVEGYDSDGKRVLLPSEYDYTNKDEEIDMWAADRASAYDWMEANAEWVDARGGKMSFFLDDADNGNGGIVFFEKVYSSLGNGSHSPALWRETLRECKTGDVYTEMGMTGGDWMVLGLAGWYDADTVSEDEIANRVSYFRCYFLASDGDKQITNDWYVDDQAFCQSLNLAAGTHYNASNKRYWRRVVARDNNPVEIDGKMYHYIDLSNEADDYDASDGQAVKTREVYGGRYERVEYIESDGTQWIDTGVSLTEDELIGEGKGIGVDMDLMMLANLGVPFGIACLYIKTENGSTTYPENGVSLLVNKSTSNENIYLAQRYNSSYDYNALIPAFNERCRIDWRASYGRKDLVVYKADGTQFSKRSNTTKSALDDKITEYLSNLNFTLFAMRRYRPFVAQKLDYLNKSKMRLYGCKLYLPKEGTLVRDYVAVRDTLTQEVGLWDRVEGKFYGKDAGNDFAAGAAVEIEKTVVDMPQADDEVVQLGNQQDTNRQSAIQLVVNGENSPKIEGLAGINDFKLDSTQRVFMFSPDGVKVRSNLFRLVTGDSESVVSRWCGKWDVGRKYYVDDEVSHNGGTWVCLADHTGVEPSEENAYYWAVKVRAAGDTNIKGVADYICDTAEEAHAYVDGLREVPFNGIVLLNDPDGTGMKAVRWVRSMIVSPSSTVRWYGIPHRTNDAYIYNDHIYIYDGTWQDRGEWHIRGADGKDAQLMVLEPSGLVLAQNIVVNGDQATYQWVPAKTTVRYVKGDRQEDVTITGVRWENLPDTSAYPFRHSISGNTITFRGLSETYEGKGFYNMIYRGFVGVRANDGYEEEIPIQVAVQSAGRFSEVIMGDMKRELAESIYFEFDEEGNLTAKEFFRELEATSKSWTQTITRVEEVENRQENLIKTVSTAIRQTADSVSIGYYADDEEVSALTIDAAGATFVGTVQSKSEDGKTYAWQLNQDGSGHVGNGGISWERNGDVTVGGRVNGMLMRKATVINSDNWENYIFQEELGGDYFIDYMKTGSYIILDSSLNSNGSFSSLGLSLPSLPLQGTYTAEKYEEEAKSVREHIGTKIMLYNYSSIGVCIETYLQPYVYKIKDGKYDKIETGIIESVTVGSRQYASLECVCETAARKDKPSEPNMEMVVWACFSANMSKDGDYEDMIITGQ